MSLRTGATEAAAQGIGLVTGEPWELYQVEADAALDALLDYLEAHADEWNETALMIATSGQLSYSLPGNFIEALRGNP